MTYHRRSVAPSHRRTIVTAVVTLLAGGGLAAQGPPILPSTTIVQAGPASLYPTVALHDVGSDSNVYRDNAAPKEDFTWSLTPRLYAVVPIAGTRFIGTARGDFVYYQVYHDQRTINGFFEGRYDFVDSLVRPFASYSYATFREQQGLEIDLKVRQSRAAMFVGSDFELTPTTALTAWVHREKYAWDPNALYDGVLLGEQLNRTEDSLAGGVSFRISPFTKLVSAIEIQRDRFEESPEKDADSLRFAPVIEFESGGPFGGQASAGYRVFNPLSPAVNGYNGFVASASITYSYNPSNRITFSGGREVRYSYEPLQPYYLESGLRLNVIQQVIGPFELIGFGERWVARYQRVGGTSFDGKREDTLSFGGGVGLLLGDQMELTFTIDQLERTSSEPGRNYDRRRVLASVTYGL